MQIRRLLSYIAVAMLGIFLWRSWLVDHPPAITTTPVEKAQPNSNASPKTFVPAAMQIEATKKPASPLANTSETKESHSSDIHIKTDVVDLTLDEKTGNIINSKLLKYPVSLQQKQTPIQIFTDEPSSYYVAQSGLTAEKELSAIVYSSTQKNYELKAADKNLVVTLTGSTASGLTVTKQYILSRNSYAIQLNYIIKNNTSKTWQGNVYTQLVRTKPANVSHGLYSRSYNEAAISNPQTKPYEQLKYKTLDEQELNRTYAGGWIAMQQPYFLSAWISANSQQNNHFYSKVTPSANGNIYIIGFMGPLLSVEPSQTAKSATTLYVGPEEAKRLSRLAPGLDHTINYGWLWPISVILFQLLSFVHRLIGNWGWAIVFTTILIKVAFYWFSATSFRSMAKMRELQPKMQQLKERYGDDKQALSRATMELYKKEKINPLGGCLPILIQIPVFIALYYVLIESVELRQAPFIFWIQDLSVKDPFYVLPILMGLSMLLQQKLSPTTADPAQAKMMMILPLVFTVFFLNFPAGLVLYWLVNNCVQILQQWYVTKTYEAHKAKKALRRSKKK